MRSSLALLQQTIIIGPRLCVLASALHAMLLASPAQATPAFARQTGEPCSVCHMESYGPYLTPEGRLFKLNGYQAGHANELPDLMNAFSAQFVGSFTNTQKAQQGGAAPGFSGNNNVVNDWDALYYTGRIADKVGAYLQLNFNPQVSDNVSLAMAEFRYADHTQLFDKNFIYGISANDGPTMSDVWMTVPEWMYPYTSSPLAPQPAGQPMMMQLMGFTGGASVYTLWNNFLYVEAGAYTSLASNMANGLGVYNNTNPLIDGGAPYWRMWMQHLWGPHVLMLGTYGMQANMYPQYNKAAGTDSWTDWNADLNYMYMVGDHMFMLMGKYTRDQTTLSASRDLQYSSTTRNYLTNTMVMAMYTFQQTYNFAFSFNNTGGSRNAAMYSPARISGSRTGLPNSEYFQLQADYVPFGKGVSATDPYLNLRFSLQYTAYTTFNGASNNYDGYDRNAQDNNTLYFAGYLMF